MKNLNHKCIFCLTTEQSVFNTVEHIIPESLGGGDWAILPKGMFCDKCQNIFGSEIEQQALATYPLVNFRTFFGVPTKKGKNAWFSTWEGKILGSGVPGVFGYDPIEAFREAYFRGRKTQMRTIAMVNKPAMLLRTLLKIGLEVYASTISKENVFSTKFDGARRYALTSKKDCPWFFLMIEDIDKLNKYLIHLDNEDWSNNIFAEIDEFENGIISLHLRLLYLDFFVPLIENVLPSEDLKETMKEPKHRIIIVD